MRVLIACEYSGIVRDAFIRKGHDAFSCDILPTEREGPHFQMPIEQLLYEYSDWDLMIAHPPCTHLAVSGASHFKCKIDLQKASIDFFMFLVRQHQIPRIAIENPVCIISTIWRRPSQIIHPWQFGESETKTTCLWLKNLPKLQTTNIILKSEHTDYLHKLPPSLTRAKERSRTFNGIARAMADQWTNKSLQPLQKSFS